MPELEIRTWLIVWSMLLFVCFVAATKQTFTVYELNEFDRDSPAFLELSRQSVNKIDPETGAHIKALGDQVPFTNKVIVQSPLPSGS